MFTKALPQAFISLIPGIETGTLTYKTAIGSPDTTATKTPKMKEHGDELQALKMPGAEALVYDAIISVYDDGTDSGFRAPNREDILTVASGSYIVARVSMTVLKVVWKCYCSKKFS